MKLFISFLFLLTSLPVFSQNKIDDLVNAELLFAKTAVDQNTKAAFLNYLDTAGDVFNEGKIQNGIEVWTARSVAKNKLLWHPVFAGIAASGDLGFTTGPWVLKSSVDNDTILASGFYTTIWHLTKESEWKVLADLGITCDPDLYKNTEIKKWTSDKAYQNKRNDIMVIEKNFITEYKQKGTDAFTNLIDDESWFNLNGSLPFNGEDEIISKGIPAIPADLKFIPVKGEMSSTNDLGYVYGIVINNRNVENYLRIWKNTKDGYKILMQVLKW